MGKIRGSLKIICKERVTIVKVNKGKCVSMEEIVHKINYAKNNEARKCVEENNHLYLFKQSGL
jgi:hypothetical protein